MSLREAPPMRRLGALYFSDIVGYTALSARDEPAALRLVALFQDLSRRMVSEHGGRVVKFVGDAVLAEFASAESAVQSALALDASLQDECGAAGVSASLRTGVHLAELTFAADGDIYGDGVNVAARLQAEAAVGRVLVSEDVWRQLRSRPVFAFTDGGRRSLKGYPDPVGTYEVRLRYEMPGAGPTPAAARTAAEREGGRARLIVLPFRILRSDAETDFLAFALADAITLSLSGLHSLTVRSSVAGLRFAGEAPDLKALAHQADVDHVVTGTLLRAGAQIRVTAQLFDAVHGTVLCSETIQSEIGDLFGLQDAMTNRIVRSLSAPLTTREQRMLKRDVPGTPRAYEFYLRANQLAHEVQSWEAARDLYREALAEDPLYAPAWARLGRCHRLLGKYAGDADRAARELQDAEAAFRKALELNPELPFVHAQLAVLEGEDGRALDAMVRLLGRARGSAVDPETWSALVHALRYCGLLEASAAADRLAKAADPAVRTSVAHTWFVNGEYERILRELPEGDLQGLREMSLVALGRREEALAATRSLPPAHHSQWFFRSWVAYLEGDEETAARAGRKAMEVFPDPEGLFYIARQWAMMDRVDEAVGLLDAVVHGGYACVETLDRDAALATIRPDPRFRAVRDRAAADRDEALARFRDADGPRLLGSA